MKAITSCIETLQPGELFHVRIEQRVVNNRRKSGLLDAGESYEMQARRWVIKKLKISLPGTA